MGEVIDAGFPSPKCQLVAEGFADLVAEHLTPGGQLRRADMLQTLALITTHYLVAVGDECGKKRMKEFWHDLCEVVIESLKEYYRGQPGKPGA